MNKRWWNVCIVVLYEWWMLERTAQGQNVQKPRRMLSVFSQGRKKLASSNLYKTQYLQDEPLSCKLCLFYKALDPSIWLKFLRWQETEDQGRDCFSPSNNFSLGLLWRKEDCTENLLWVTTSLNSCSRMLNCHIPSSGTWNIFCEPDTWWWTRMPQRWPMSTIRAQDHWIPAQACPIVSDNTNPALSSLEN